MATLPEAMYAIGALASRLHRTIVQSTNSSNRESGLALRGIAQAVHDAHAETLDRGGQNRMYQLELV
jgi:hypothetical protein